MNLEVQYKVSFSTHRDVRACCSVLVPNGVNPFRTTTIEMPPAPYTGDLVLSRIGIPVSAFQKFLCLLIRWSVSTPPEFFQWYCPNYLLQFSKVQVICYKKFNTYCYCTWTLLFQNAIRIVLVTLRSASRNNRGLGGWRGKKGLKRTAQYVVAITIETTVKYTSHPRIVS